MFLVKGRFKEKGLQVHYKATSNEEFSVISDGHGDAESLC